MTTSASWTGSMDEEGRSFFLVGNIPARFHSYDLRAFFSHFVEKGGFRCFHFRHRPEHLATRNNQDSVINKEWTAYRAEERSIASKDSPGKEREVEDATGPSDVQAGVDSSPEVRAAGTTCCVVAVKSTLEEEFMQLYNGTNWADSKGEELPLRVRLHRLYTRSRDGAAELSPSRAQQQLEMEDLTSLPELNPPTLMPEGNVGTPLATFMSMIKSCKLPTQVIKKLHLEFPKSRSARRYGAVPLDYGPKGDGEILSQYERKWSSKSVSVKEPVSSASSSKKQEFPRRRKYESDDTDSISANKAGSASADEEEEEDDDDDLGAEEWERYEALHEDVDKQARTKERLFEEEMEVVWDKGSSGLVFYTDASHWDQVEGGFDEQCSKEDDWDVDMGVYYGYESADKDAVDMREMEVEQRLREGEDLGSWRGVAAGFEQHTKAIGSRVMRSCGWKKGQGLGREASGISEPLEAEGQDPSCKRGLGYRGEKLIAGSRKKKACRDVLISTVYDIPDEKESTPLRSAPPTTLKHRPRAGTVKFVKGQNTESGTSSTKDS